MMALTPLPVSESESVGGRPPRIRPPKYVGQLEKLNEGRLVSVGSIFEWKDKLNLQMLKAQNTN